MRPAPGVFFVVVVVFVTVLAGPALAQEGIFEGMQKRLDFTFGSSSLTTTLPSGQVTRTEATSLSPVLTLNVDALVYPNLRLNAGGVWELRRSAGTTDGLDLMSTQTSSRPFFLLRSANPMFSPGFGYFRREDTARSVRSPKSKLINEEYAAYLGWYPSAGPRSDFQFVRTNTFDGDRSFEDLSKAFGSMLSAYNYKGFGAYYNGSYVNSEDRLRSLNTKELSNAARVTYSGRFLQNRLFWNATYDISHLDVTTVANGRAGEVLLPVTASAGLSLLSDTPANVTLSQNPSLMDGSLTASAGVNIGLPAQPTDTTRARNIGLDFLVAVEVNSLRVWVDREIPIEIARSFSWEIYSSTDNVLWQREATVSPAPFGPFENRFQVDFPSFTARYIKVVTRPLSPIVQDASRYPDILVTELQGFLRRQAGAGTNSFGQILSRLNTDVRMRILNSPSLFYEGSYLYSSGGRFGVGTDTLSNGLQVAHTFARIFSAFARVSYEQGAQQNGHYSGTLTSATLTVDPIRTFKTSLLYTGRDYTVSGLLNSRKGVFVQNAAQVYRGVDVLFGFGGNFTTRETGEHTRDRLVNVSATVAPHRRVGFSVSYDGITTSRSGISSGSAQLYSRRAYAAVVLDPLRTLHLSVGEEVYLSTGQRTRTTLSAGLNWAPLQGGALQFVFAYNNALRPLEFGSERDAVAGVRWNISRRSYIDVSYRVLRSDWTEQTTRGKTLSTSLRLFL